MSKTPPITWRPVVGREIFEARLVAGSGRSLGWSVGYVAHTPGDGDDQWRGYVGLRHEPVGMGQRAAVEQAAVEQAAVEQAAVERAAVERAAREAWAARRGITEGLLSMDIAHEPLQAPGAAVRALGAVAAQRRGRLRRPCVSTSRAYRPAVRIDQIG